MHHSLEGPSPRTLKITEFESLEIKLLKKLAAMHQLMQGRKNKELKKSRKMSRKSSIDKRQRKREME